MRRLILIMAATGACLAVSGAASGQIYSYCKYPKVCPEWPPMPMPPINRSARQSAEPKLLPIAKTLTQDPSWVRGPHAK
jgi:hypothetical protein